MILLPAAGKAPDPILQARGVYKVFIARGGDARMALRDVGLRVHRGEFLCLIGPSGCGKSTVLNMFAGLVTPSDGSILHDGVAINDVNTRVGYVTQDDNLLPWRTALANVELALECKDVPQAERRDRALDYLGRVANATDPAGRTLTPVARDRQDDRLRHARYRRSDRLERPHRHIYERARIDQRHPWCGPATAAGRLPYPRDARICNDI